MTTKHPALFRSDAAALHPANSFRRLIGEIFFDEEGYLGATDSFKVIVKSGGGLSFLLQPGTYCIKGTENATQGTYFLENTAPQEYELGAADSSNPRVDSIYLAVYDQEYSGTENLWKLEIVAGTPAASPSAPDGSFSNSVKIAEIQVPAGAAELVPDGITDLRVHLYSNSDNINIANGSITNALFEDNAITDRTLTRQNILREKIAHNQITGEKIREDTIDAEEIDNGSIESRHIKTGAARADTIKDGAAVNRIIGANAIQNRHVADGTITAPKLAFTPGSIIPPGLVTTEKITDRTLQPANFQHDPVQRNTADDTFTRRVGYRAELAPFTMQSSFFEGYTDLNELRNNTGRYFDHTRLRFHTRTNLRSEDSITDSNDIEQLAEGRSGAWRTDHSLQLAGTNLNMTADSYGILVVSIWNDMFQDSTFLATGSDLDDDGAYATNHNRSTTRLLQIQVAHPVNQVGELYMRIFYQSHLRRISFAWAGSLTTDVPDSILNQNNRFELWFMRVNP